MTPCIGEPVSWPRLEAHAAGPRDPTIAAHVVACAACRACLDDIARDVVALPPLAIAAPARRRAWWWAAPVVAAAAAVVLIVIARPRDRDPDRDDGDAIARVKGVGEVVLGTIRERAGTITDDAREFAPGDRWKVVVSCAPGKGAWIDVAVVDAGARRVDYPLAPARVGCGNRVVVPGAFVLDGARPNQVCVRIGVEAAPPRAMPRAGDDAVACVTIRPR